MIDQTAILPCRQGHSAAPSNSRMQCALQPQDASILAQPCSHRKHTEVEDDMEHDSAEEGIPTAWWVGGLLASGAFCTALLTPMLDLPVIDPLAAVALALLVAVLAVRALGQTDLNPVSGVGKLSQVGSGVVAVVAAVCRRARVAGRVSRGAASCTGALEDLRVLFGLPSCDNFFV